MIIEQNINTIQTNGIKLTKEMGINHEGMGFIQNILRSQIYSCKISAVIREIAVNGFDSHVEAGCPERPIEVTLPSRYESTFKVRDFGTGMSEDTILNLYAYFGSSSKRNTNLQSGFMGIGKVAPLSYTDSFVLTSFFNGVKNTYNIYVDSNNLSQISKLASEPTAEKNGIEVAVAVNDYDIQTFHDKAKTLFHYFKVRPIIHGATFTYENKPALMEGSDWVVYGDKSVSVAVMGNISYPIADHFENADISAALSCGIEIQFGIGDVSVSASRESLEYNTRTKQVIKDKLIRIVKEISDELNIRFNTCATLFDAHKLYGTVMDFGSNLYAMRSMIKSCLVFKGTNIRDSVMRFDYSANYSMSKYECGYRNRKIKGQATNRVNCSAKTVLIENDLGISNGIVNRVYNSVTAGNDVYVLSYTTPQEKQKFLDASGLEDSNFIKLSSLPKISLSNATGTVKNSKHSSKEFIYDYYSGSCATRSTFWKQEVVDIANDAGVYVILESFKYQDKNGMLSHPSELCDIIESLNVFGITIPKLYGFKVAKKDVVQKNTNMVTLWNYIATELTNYFATNKIAQKLADRICYDNNIGDNWNDSLEKISSLVDSKTIFAKTAEMFNYMKHAKDKKILDEAVNWKQYYTMTETPKYDLSAQAELVNKTYPVFEYIRSWETDKKFVKSVADYVTLVGS